MHLHGAVGVVLLLVALFGMLEALAREESAGTRSLGPLCAAAGGALLVVYVAIEHSRQGAHAERGDAAHWVIGLALMTGGLLTWRGRSGVAARFIYEMALPFAALAVAAMFVVHADPGVIELVLHVSIAICLVGSSLAHLSFILTGEGRGLRMFAALLLALGALLLIFFDVRTQLGGPSGGH